MPTASLTSGSHSGAPGSSSSESYWGKDVVSPITKTTMTQQQQQQHQGKNNYRLPSTHSKQHPRSSIPGLVNHLEAISTNPAVPKTIFVGGDNNHLSDKDSQSSLVSKLSSLPEELCFFRNQRHQKKRNAQRRVVVVSAAGDDDDTTARIQGLQITLHIGGQVEKGLYSGELDDQGCPSGTGIIKFDNNDLYIGELELGKMHGKGTLVFSNAVLRGEFQENLFVV